MNLMLVILRLGLTMVSIFIADSNAATQIVPGASLITVNTGEPVQAHGAGFIKVGNLYYMMGEDKTKGSNFQNVNCYSSANLVDWEFAGALVSQEGSGDLGPGRVVERPKVLHNKATGKYVLFMHIDSGKYGEAKVGVAVGDSVCGKYRYVGSWRPLGHESRDMGVFQENDGTGYVLSEDRSTGLRIYRLAPDYLSVTANVYTWKEKIEAPAMLKMNGLYYMFGSHLSGWTPNDNVYSTSRSPSGPWSEWKTFAPKGSRTFNSQTNYVLPITNRLAIYMGDRWIEKNLSRSTYVWLPLQINGPEVSMRNYDSWEINAAQGTWQPSLSEPTYSCKQAALGGGAKLISNDAVGYIGGPSNGTISWTNIDSGTARQKTLKIYFRNGDRTPRYAALGVNGQPPVKMAFLGTEDVGVAVRSVALVAGKNIIKIDGFKNLWGPDIISLKVSSS